MMAFGRLFLYGGNMAKEKIRVKLRGFDVELVDQSSKAIVQAVQKVGAKVLGPVPLPTRINKFTVLRSPHVKKSRVSSLKCGRTSD